MINRRGHDDKLQDSGELIKCSVLGCMYVGLSVAAGVYGKSAFVVLSAGPQY